MALKMVEQAELSGLDHLKVQLEPNFTEFHGALQQESRAIEFKECPEGVVHEESFKDIYAKFFTNGNATLYAHYVFRAFDVNCNGAISFRDLLITLSTLLRGSVYERLRWTFKLYDINGDGCISRGELSEIIVAVHELMGRKTLQVEEDRQAREQVDRVFKKLDLNQDGVITIEEFMESCPCISQSNYF